MKTFSLGFILAFITFALVQHVNIMMIKEFFESMIITTPSTLLLIFICWQSIKSGYLYFTHKKRFCLLNNNWQCLLIDGAWGSGKTTHYETYYKYIDDKPNIYISCFSASRSELIAQIIQQQFWCKLLTLNGLLAKFMESNWQIFMPKNRVVVFDDLERLHTGKESYLDLIGIIDYIKCANKCKIILICNMSELKSYKESNKHIFNSYMERIVDELEFPKLIPRDEFRKSLINQPNELTKELLNKLYERYENDEINNLRIIKNIMPTIADKLKIDYSEFNEIEQVINGAYYELIKLINKHYLFYIDNALFKECSDINNGKTSGNQIEKTELEAKLNKFKLKHEDFKCIEYKTFRDIKKILSPDLGNYLKGDIDSLISNDDYDRAKCRVNEYLDKFATGKSNNSFVVYQKTNNYLQNDQDNLQKDRNYSHIFILLLCYLIWLDVESEDIIDKIALTYIDKFMIRSVCNTDLRIAYIDYGAYFKAFDQETYFNDNILLINNRHYVNGHSGRVSKHNDPKLNKFLQVFKKSLVEAKIKTIINDTSDIYELPFYDPEEQLYQRNEILKFCNSKEDQEIYDKYTNTNDSSEVFKVIEVIYCYCNSTIFNQVLKCQHKHVIQFYNTDFITQLNKHSIEYNELLENINHELLKVLKKRLSEYTTTMMWRFGCENLDELVDPKNQSTRKILKNLLEDENIK